MSRNATANLESPCPPSKRAARRILQRAFVLTGRDRQLRQHIRETRLTFLWILEDWDLVWTIVIDRGKIEFDRRPARHPDMTFRWRTANEFFTRASLSSQSFSRRGEITGSPGPQSGASLPRLVDGNDGEGARPDSFAESPATPEAQRVARNLLNFFFGYLGHVLRNPVDGAGESLL